jgi:prepilin-type N-terminal cleavage/methylation domain-containing protein/prepilin-type processing-associated H-X9-DG protein
VPLPRAFTLVEMLVVLGLIAVLAALLLPAIANARRSALATACAGNLRQIGAAVHLYLQAVDDTLPDASSTNSPDSPYSPYAGRTDDAVPQPLRPVGELLDPYLRYGLAVWKCPAQPRGKPAPVRTRTVETFRTGRYVTLGRRAVDNDVNVPEYLWESTGEWRPGYLYLSTKEYLGFRDAPDVLSGFWMNDWLVRNVAGLTQGDLKTSGRQGTSQIVLFTDYSSRFHSRAPDDVYDLRQLPGLTSGASPNPASSIRRDAFRSNFLYLDGHVESREYAWQGGYLNQIHRPIRQKIGNMSLVDAYGEYYQREFPD